MVVAVRHAQFLVLTIAAIASEIVVKQVSIVVVAARHAQILALAIAAIEFRIAQKQVWIVEANVYFVKHPTETRRMTLVGRATDRLPMALIRS